ncbi:hypothetical protein M0R45_013002 [Rubus argutus]|uniref:Uncharacterized protein n=1 Tax=Rubus argutus TaxID=59490 RepID=A0AAW1XHX1_RUBAR
MEERERRRAPDLPLSSRRSPKFRRDSPTSDDSDPGRAPAIDAGNNTTPNHHLWRICHSLSRFSGLCFAKPPLRLHRISSELPLPKIRWPNNDGAPFSASLSKVLPSFSVKKKKKKGMMM